VISLRALRLLSLVTNGVVLAWRRKLSTQIALVILVTAGLLTAPLLVNRLRGVGLQDPTRSVDAEPAVRKFATTSTDLNLRSGPSHKDPKVGLAERSSRVRILSCNQTGNWCEVEVLQHGREKLVPNSLDRGWVNKRYLQPVEN
jgi:hypothetical protein